MSESPAITVPIAQCHSNTATATLPHFVQGAEYKPKAATHCPLVNGEDAFRAVYDAIVKATHTVDIVCWGFQPSMYFKRDVSEQGSLPIGQLLLEMARAGVRVRLLVWGDKLHVANALENMMPGGRLSVKPDNRNSAQAEFDSWWYRMVRMDKKNQSGTDGSIVEDFPPFFVEGVLRKAVNHASLGRRDPAFRNIEFATRDFDMNERAEIAWRTANNSEYGERTTGEKIIHSGAMGGFVSHHQKMVLIDYEQPELATGFVMGHNTLDEYWDTSRHSHVRMHAQFGRNGFHPRQDISARVTGPILIDLNRNFCQAWDAATGQELTKQRKDLPLCFGTDEHDVPVMAQIVRTQSQYGKDVRLGKAGIRDIEKLYLQAINNTSNFVYIENQYFRFPPLAQKLKTLVRAYQEGGRKSPLYLFVVTNSSDDGIGLGTVSTYQMLNVLGRTDVLPGVAKLERVEDVTQQYGQALEVQKQANQVLDRAMHTPVNPFSGSGQYAVNNMVASQQEAAEADRRVAELKAQLERAKTEDPQRVAIDGLNVHICTLVPPDTPVGQAWDEVYIHSKLMIVDDVFVTHGSANVNLRSMEADSELNIFHESMQVTQPLREKLWDIHTGGMGVGKKDERGRLDAADAFKAWKTIMDENKRRKLIRNTQPYASLIEFYRDDATRSYID